MIIGLDGGGTKTTGMVVDEQGRILAEATVGPTNPNSSDYETVKKELKKLFYFFTLKKPLTKDDVVFAGISGVESGGKKEWFLSLLREITGEEPTIIIDNDAITALYSETKGKPGIVSISGTGSISFGINDKEERARVGGWGYLIQDGSSGFAIGKRLLDYVFEQYDKGHAPCELTRAVLDHFGVSAMSEIVSLVYELQKTRDRVASLGSMVISFSIKGNQLCVDFLKEAAACMLREIHTLYEKLHQGRTAGGKLPIVLTGGIIQHSHVMQSFLEEKAANRNYPFAFTLPSLPPIAGTIYAAIKNGEHEVAPTFTEVFEKEVRDRSCKGWSMMNGGLLRLRQALSAINPAERNAATFILENPREVVTLSVKELAEKSDSSQAAIIRLCKKIGLDGYKELKLRIAGDMTSFEKEQEEYHEFKDNDDIPTFMKTITENNVLSLRDTLHLLDKNEVEAAVHYLHTSNRIDFYGVGASQLIAQDAQLKFMRINKLCTAYADAHIQLTSAATLTNRDVAVGISYSGETSHTLAAIRQAKEAGAKTIAITKYGSNSLKELADITLCISSMESSIRSAATSSRISQLNVIDILFTAVAARDFDQSVAYLKRSREAVQKAYRSE